MPIGLQVNPITFCNKVHASNSTSVHFYAVREVIVMQVKLEFASKMLT